MSDQFYLPRTLTSDDKTYSEAELLAVSKHIVVLAEPGGGKTELMNSLANQVGTTAVTANVFGQVGAAAENHPIVIDAFDELAKVDQAGINRLLGNARKAAPTHVIVSSRSSEWNSAATISFKDFLGHAPLVVRLREFDDSEQRAIFEHHAPGEDFAAFQGEVARFELESLLPNPQFLKLFADAFIESGRRFTDKRSIFVQAVERLAKEANVQITTSGLILGTTKKVELASEVFAKILLSGAEGISTSEANETRMYPLLTTLFDSVPAADGILATRLFKPGNSADEHRPVHKIVSEYCAANYLIKRIADPADPLTLSKCLPIIAPNSTVRDELRGLLGWMASLGTKPIQEAAIELDPYAVLANGDPSQLEPSSKRLLLNRLKDTEDKDPYFRRGDFMRRFSVAGFFTQDVLDEIRPLLMQAANGHLRELILELLRGSPAISQLADELQKLCLAPNEGEHIREMASKCLLEMNDYDHHADLSALIFEASQTSLAIASKILESLDIDRFDNEYIANFLRACANLYPGHRERLERSIGSRYFVKRFISKLSLETTQSVLDILSRDIECKCGKKDYECDCRNGISKIIGSMLDHYFETAHQPHSPKRIWQWVENLNFHEQRTVDRSKAVQELQENSILRQGIIALVFGHLTDRDEIFKLSIYKFGWHGHSGLQLQMSDYKFLADLAFHTNNLDLWSCFVARHQCHRSQKNRGPDDQRRHMRTQALEKPAFMREWAKSNRIAKQSQIENKVHNFRPSRRMKRNNKQQADIHAANVKYVKDNRELVESGRHWSCLCRFAELVLMHPELIEEEFGDEVLVRSALKNCLDFIAPYVPNLGKLAELNCASQSQQSETILYAACLEIFRTEGSLKTVDAPLLLALKTNLDMGYNAVKEDDREALRAEVDQILFPTLDKVEDFCRQYLEPQLAASACKHPQTSWLRYDKVLAPLAEKLSFEWLHRYENMPFSALNDLFDLAAQNGNFLQLKQLVANRCAEILSASSPLSDTKEFDQLKKFWFLRGLYFLDGTDNPYWQWLKADKNTVLILYERSGRPGRREHSNWPSLTAHKIESILDAFIDKWPKVDLPSSWGTGSPEGENAYRFLTEVVWSIDSDDPDHAIPVLSRLLADRRFVDFHKNLKSMKAGQIRKKALRDFEPPSPQEIVNQLDNDSVVTVEGLRQLVIDELLEYQKAIDGGEFNSGNRFYEKGERLDEVRCTEIISERLSLRLQPKGIVVTPEHQLKSANRSDFTATKMMGGTRRLLVTEVKGQWHGELYTAAAAQLHERYSIHQDAEQQGIFLVIWFGPDEKVAGIKNRDISSANELKVSIKNRIPADLVGLIDIFVLDVSRTERTPIPTGIGTRRPRSK